MAIADIVVDAGPFIGNADKNDKHHASSLQFFEQHPGPYIVPILVIPEVAHVLCHRLGAVAEQHFLNDLNEDNFRVEPVADEDWPRIRELVARYRGFPLGTVDAAVMAAAERLHITDIATVDQRHFRAVQPRHCISYTLHPWDT